VPEVGASGRGGAVARDARSSRWVSASVSTAVAIAIVITGQRARDPLGGRLRRSWIGAVPTATR
jgi:hypothetical protein